MMLFQNLLQPICYKCQPPYCHSRSTPFLLLPPCVVMTIFQLSHVIYCFWHHGTCRGFSSKIAAAMPTLCSLTVCTAIVARTLLSNFSCKGTMKESTKTGQLGMQYWKKITSNKTVTELLAKEEKSVHQIKQIGLLTKCFRKCITIYIY